MKGDLDRSFGDVLICFDILKLICETDTTHEGDRREQLIVAIVFLLFNDYLLSNFFLFQV